MGITILKLLLVSLIPINLSIGLRVLLTRTKLKDKKESVKQIIVGLIFGIGSILGTVFGVATETGAIINVRDASPICAALIFGGPAGIISGVIGGVYRLIDVYVSGVGFYTRWACSISTVMSGIFAAIIKKFVFDNKDGKWFYGTFLGLQCEAFHMLMVYLTHINDVEGAYNVVAKCGVPMMIVNAFAVGASIVSVTLLNKEKLIKRYKLHKLGTYLQIYLLSSLIFAYTCTALLTYTSMKKVSDNKIESIFELTVGDIKDEVGDSIDSKVLSYLYSVKEYTETSFADSKEPSAIITTLLNNFDFSEVNFVSKQDKIIYSNLAVNVGFDMNTPGQSTEFACLNKNTETYIQTYGPISRDSSINIKYAGIKLTYNDYNVGYIQIGYDENSYHSLLDNEFKNVTANRHVEFDGFTAVVSENGHVVSSLEGSPIGNIFKIRNSDLLKRNTYTFTIRGIPTEYYFYGDAVEGYYILCFLSSEASKLDTRLAISEITYVEIFVFLTLYAIIYIALKYMFVDKTARISKALKRMSHGDLNIEINERKTYEFNLLSDGINSTVNTLKEYAKEETLKFEKDLALAKQIQASVLPNSFPAYPYIPQFDLFASMTPAKEVGGDFYDFFLIDAKHIAVQVADVSGKGIPGAMFMMQSKSILKSLVGSGMDIGEAYTEANRRLCDHNDAQMFVTAWLGVIDLDSGHVEYVNAGHNPPLVKHKNGKFEYLIGKKGFVLGGLDSIHYKKQSLDLEIGDQLFIYTDGVTEATNTSGELYGEARLEYVLNENCKKPAELTVNLIIENVKKFTKGAEQSDDITMLCFNFLGDSFDKKKEVKANIDSVPEVIDFVVDFLSENKVNSGFISKMNVVVDEIFSNIANYAYPNNDDGRALIEIKLRKDNKIELCFTDGGIPYNPLEHKDPDITLGADDRAIGGLGIFIVKKIMDEVSYERGNNLNILKLIKDLSKI